MIDKPYFVILNHQKDGLYLPLVDDDDRLAMFESEIDATVAGNENPLGNAFGFEVFVLSWSRPASSSSAAVYNGLS